jgi:glyoxylase-like metal-dependent hydrolase (beta-lactamase superfamily II)
MRRIVVLVVGVFMASLAAAATAEEQDLPFRVQRLTDHVLVFTEISPWESNHVVIESAKGLVLVDPGHTPLMGRLIRQAVARELGRDQFAYVIDTHGHWGHTWGAAAFPEAMVIGHERAAGEMQPDVVNPERQREAARGQLAQAETRLAELDPEDPEAAPAQIQRDHLDRIVRGLSEPGFEVRMPQLTFSDRLTLDLGDLSLEMHYLGGGHSLSDIAVLIPEEKILLMGCFIYEQGPLPIFGIQPDLDPERWIEVFGDLLDDESGIEFVVLGQYSVWPRARLAAIRDYIVWLWTEVQRLDIEGVDFETALARLPIPDELDFVRQAGASEEDVARYQRVEAKALWRQLKESAATKLAQAIDESGVEAGVAQYRELAALGSADVYFDENEFNLLGYRYLGEQQVEAAIAVFEINVERFPDSWNVYDSLGEACAANGDTERAIQLYRRSVELNPDNGNGVQAIERLEAEAGDGQSQPEPSAS